MIAIALATPLLVLAVLQLLHKMEVWVLDEPTTRRVDRALEGGRRG